MIPCVIGNSTLQPYRIFSIPQIQFTRGFSMLTMATFATCHLQQSLTTWETQASSLPHARRGWSVPYNRAIYQGFPNRCPIRCYFHFSFVSPKGTMNFHFSKGISHPLSNWEDLACTNMVHHCSPPGQSTTGEASPLPAQKAAFKVLASIIFLLDIRSPKSEVFEQLKVLRLQNNLHNHLISFRQLFKLVMNSWD